MLLNLEITVQFQPLLLIIKLIFLFHLDYFLFMSHNLHLQFLNFTVLDFYSPKNIEILNFFI